MNPPYVTRFAPSPTGCLHRGHAYAALVAWQQAQVSGGSFLLRFEDIDVTRVRPEYYDGILDDLDWLGFKACGPHRRQSEHWQDYQGALDQLQQQGLLYPCFCTRKDIATELANVSNAPHGPDGPIYPGTCRHLSEAQRESRLAGGLSYSLRLDLKKALALISEPLGWKDLRHGSQRARPEVFGDVILARKDIPTSYHLAVTVDDALQGITLVTRGEDLLPATHLHRLLQALLGLPSPEYLHHPLICDAQGKRLAKRDHAESLRSLRALGHTAEAIIDSFPAVLL
jgi:glutamyl-Q tRNA(Asp) synthetase